MLSPSLRETNTYGGRHYRKKPSTVWGTAPFPVRFSGGRNRSQAGVGSMSGPQPIQTGPISLKCFDLQRLLDKR